MTQNPSVSVLIPTHRRPHLLRECLQSLTIQTLKPNEVIVLENGPIKISEEICDEFIGKLPIKYFWDPIANVSRARNILVDKALNEIIAFIDDDCLAARDWLENLIAPFYRDPKIGAVGGDYLPDLAQKGWVANFIRQAMERSKNVNKNR